MNASEKSDNKPGIQVTKNNSVYAEQIKHYALFEVEGRKENRIEKQIAKLSTEKTTISTENKLRCYQFPQRFVSK